MDSVFLVLRNTIMKTALDSLQLKVLNLAVFICAMWLTAGAQIFQDPIGGSIYGQPIVACCATKGQYESAATVAAIYVRSQYLNEYYTRVWSAPLGLHIISFDVQHKNNAYYRAVLLADGSGNNFTIYAKIKAPAADSVIHGPVLLPPPLAGKYTTIVGGGSLHIFSILAGGPAGNLTFSLDNGLTWQPDTLGIGYDNVWDVATDTAGNAVIAGGAGIYRQAAADSAWTILHDNTYNPTKIFIDRQNRILISNYGINTHISLDNGATFIGDSVGLSGPVSKLAGDAYGNFYAVAGGLFRHMGGTNPWVDISLGFNAVTRNDGQYSCIAGDSLLTIGTSNWGMFTSTDKGNTWQPTNNGISAEDIFSIITQPDGRSLCTTDLGIFYKDPADTLWHPTTPITSFYPGNLLFNDPEGTVFVAVLPTVGSPYPLGKSIDNGVHFNVDSNGFSSIGGSGFYIDETGARYFYNYYASGTNPLPIWKSSLGSSNWMLDTAGLPIFPIYGTGVKYMLDDQQGFVYASVDMPNGDILFRRSVNSNNWLVDTAGLGASLNISPMASNAALGILLASGTQLYRRTSGGWINLPNVPTPGGSSSAGINAISIDDHDNIYLSFSDYNAQDSNAVFVSRDTGNTWQFAGLMGMNIYNLTSTGDTTYALTLGNWGYVVTSPLNAGILPTSAPPANIRVFPNPSSQYWNIQADEQWLNSRFEICDVSGQVVYDGVINSTNTAIRPQNLSSGAYLLRVYNANDSATRWLIK